MNDERKTKAQLIAELAAARQRVIELEAAEAERQRLDAALRASETRYRRLFETAQDGILLLDAATGQITDVNLFLIKMLGYSHAEFVGKHLWEVGPFKDVAESKLAFEQLQTNEYIRYEDLPLETRDGRRMEVEFVSNVYLVNGNKVIQCNVRDIAERKQLETEIQDAREYAENIVETVREPLVVLNADLKILTANHSFYETFKVSPEETIGNFIYDLGNRQWDIPKLRVLFEEILPHDTVFNGYEVEHDFLDIGRKVILLNARQIFRENIGSRIILVAMEDITERKQLETEIQDAREYAENIVETVREPLVVLNADLKILTANHSFYETFKVSPEETIGNFIYDLGNRQWDIPKLRVLFEEILPQDTVFNGYEVEHAFLNIGRKIILLNARQIFRENIGSHIVLLAMEDITARKQAEAALQELNAMLEQRVADRTRRLYEANAQLSDLDQLKDQFISRISHELRTPLSNIINYLDLLEHGKPEKRAQYLQVLHEQAALLRELIESLLEVTQKSVNAAGVHVAPTDLNQLATSLIAEVAPRAAQRGLTLTSALTPELPFVSADGRLLAQALSKLAANALNYTPAGGTIDLATAEVIDAGATWITFTIRDSGPGIALDELAHIFDRFYRGRAAADYKTPGVGVGLSISRDILTSLDGRLTVDSQPGEGATFTAWLKPA